MSNPDYNIPNDENVSPDDIQPGADLIDADLSDASLNGADLTDAILYEANLTEVDLSGADISEADFLQANLSDANLMDTNASGTELSLADLSGADLRDADLSEAKLRDADLSNVLMVDTNLNHVTMSRRTNIDPPGERIKQSLAGENVPKEQQYDIIARANHQLREAFSGNGLLGKARMARVRERRARRKEAKAEGGFRGYADWFLSGLSSIFTGYGVQLYPVIAVMLILYFASTFIYWNWGGMAWDYSLYYSVVTFTTSPPEIPPDGISGPIAGIETFAGTAAIVFLGYILGTRERV